MLTSKTRSGRKRLHTFNELSSETFSEQAAENVACEKMSEKLNETECTNYEIQSVEPTRSRRKRTAPKEKKIYHSANSLRENYSIPQKEHHLQEIISLTIKSSKQSLNQSQILDVFPESIIGACFFEGYLDSMEIITSLSLVSRSVRQIGRETVKSLDLRNFTNLRPNDLNMLVHTFYNLTNLDFSYSPQFSDNHLVQLSPLTRTLRRLFLKGCKVSDKGLMKYLEQSSNNCDGQNLLEEIDLSAISKTDNLLIGDESVVAISKCCKNLRKLNLGWCKRVSDSCTESLLRLKKIEDLDLSITSISSESCYNLSQLHSLKKLQLDATNICCRGVETLFTARKMVKLNHPDNEDLIMAMKWNSHICRLERISLRFIENLDLNKIEILSANCTYLKFIDLTHCHGMPFGKSQRQALTKLAERGISVKISFCSA